MRPLRPRIRLFCPGLIHSPESQHASRANDAFGRVDAAPFRPVESRSSIAAARRPHREISRSQDGAWPRASVSSPGSCRCVTIVPRLCALAIPDFDCRASSKDARRNCRRRRLRWRHAANTLASWPCLGFRSRRGPGNSRDPHPDTISEFQCDYSGYTPLRQVRRHGRMKKNEAL